MNQETTMTTIWYQLTTADGKRVPGTTVDFVELAQNSTVGNLRKEVKKECANDLEKVDSNQLLVYASKSELDVDIAASKTLTGLKPGTKVDTLPETNDDSPLLIVVPERKEVKKELKRKLEDYDPVDLLVYANEAALDTKVPLEVDQVLESLLEEARGKGAKITAKNPLQIVVPDSQPTTSGEISDLTTRLRSFANAQLVEGCIQSQDQKPLPYPQDIIEKLYVRKCYPEVCDLLLRFIGERKKSFAISGTPGIGKSLFFVYILYRLMDDFRQKTLPLKPKRVVYQLGSEYICFDLQEQLVTSIEKVHASVLVRKQETFYVIDGPSEPLISDCVVLFISSPRSERYKNFVKQKMAKEWYLPVWTLDELQACQRHCYPDLSIELLQERHRICGGVARLVYHSDYTISGEDMIHSALTDVDAVSGVKYVGATTSIFPDSHALMHILVGENKGNAYKFTGLDVASKYVGEQLWIQHSAVMITNLQNMFGGSPNEISRHLFEIYGHRVFSAGGRTLECRCLESGTDSEIAWTALHGQRTTFGKDTIPTAEDLSGNYYEPTDDDTFPAIDSLSAQGMFQFTVAAEHPIRGIQILRRLCKLYDEPKLYFVVPPHRFAAFKKQSFKGKKGPDDGRGIPNLKQYVLKLPVEQ